MGIVYGQDTLQLVNGDMSPSKLAEYKRTPSPSIVDREEIEPQIGPSYPQATGQTFRFFPLLQASSNEVQSRSILLANPGPVGPGRPGHKIRVWGRLAGTAVGVTELS